MRFSDLVNFFRQSHEGTIVFINSGAFYIAIEEDAVLLNNKLKLKCSCFQKHTCKVGVPINAIDKYLEKIRKLGYSYIVYNLDREKKEINIVDQFEGKKYKTEKKNINCLLCKGIDENNNYMQALENLYRKQQNEGKK